MPGHVPKSDVSVQSIILDRRAENVNLRGYRYAAFAKMARLHQRKKRERIAQAEVCGDDVDLIVQE